MHAASVYPEPGSNSLKKLYIKQVLRTDRFSHWLTQSLIPSTAVSSLDTVSLELLIFCSYTLNLPFDSCSKRIVEICDYLYFFSVSNFLSFLWKPHCFVLHLISCCSIFKDHLACRSLWVSLALATYILYHILSRLSRGFAKVFEVFLGLLRFARLSLTALILYHRIYRMSIPFNHFYHICHLRE